MEIYILFMWNECSSAEIHSSNGFYGAATDYKASLLVTFIEKINSDEKLFYLLPKKSHLWQLLAKYLFKFN